ncbi:hypothetical protein AVEN_121857-1 [Araneus ventricosus]|uniref:Uncharacterized protein n=1 Tax=Araneus ventricosus TaxID=182803 RepID=A0A4Y2N9C3_ARAVE|nr:hypothetical protein AVEN_121857-1 [Araneus ventricosus]
MKEYVMQTEQDLNVYVDNIGKEKHVKKVTPAHLILARMKEYVMQTEQDLNVYVDNIGKEKHVKKVSKHE